MKLLALSALVVGFTIAIHAQDKPATASSTNAAAKSPADADGDHNDKHAGHAHADASNTNGIRLADGTIVPPLKANTNKIVLTNIYMAAAYIMGIQDAGNIFMQGYQEHIDPEIYIRGFRDVYGNYKPLIPLDQAEDILKDFSKQMERLDAEKNMRLAETNRVRGREFLEANKKKEGVVTTPTGLQYKIIKEGKGAKPTLEDRVAVHFTGKTINGMEFSSSHKHKEPTVVPLRYQIDGWKEALQMMSEGSVWELYIPSELAYKEREVGRGVGGNSTLVFELELVRIERAKPGQITP